MTLLRIVRLLALVVWVGGLIFFAFVLAPTAFSVLPSTHEAGTIVGATLAIINHIGMICGTLYLLAIIAPAARSRRIPRIARIQILLVLLMLAATAYVQGKIVPAMERDRIAAGGDIDAAPADNPARLDFERLHPISEKVEGSVLLFGIGAVILVGLEGRTQESVR